MSALERLLRAWEANRYRLIHPPAAARAVRRALTQDHRREEPPTERMAPLRDTVLRRPPVPVRELRGAALLRALAEELDREGLDLDDLEARCPVCGGPYGVCEGVH